MAGSMHANPHFIVRLYKTGQLRSFDQNDIQVYGNPMQGNGWDIENKLASTLNPQKITQ
jgi:hypothetical protein